MLDSVIYKNIEIFKVKLRWSKSSLLLQRVAFLVLFEFDLFIDFPSLVVVHIPVGSKLDFCMIFVNDDWTLLYDCLLHLTLRKCIAHASFFLCGKKK